VLLGVDVGGTFTDAVLATGGRLVTAKAPTTPGDQSLGVMAAVGAALERAGAQAAEVQSFAHGMTVATNALLEGRGARTVLVATAGFTDIGRARAARRRADLYRLCAARPAPLVPPERRISAPERTGPEGVLSALEDPDALAAAVATHEPEAVAVVLLHAYAHPGHERAIGDALAAALPGVHVSLSHEVVGTFSRVRARRDDRGRRRAVAAARKLPAAAAGPRAGGGPAAAADHAVQRRPGGGRARGAPRVLSPSSRAPPAAPPRRRSSPAAAAARTSSASTWAAPPATSASSRTAPCARTAGREVGGRPLALAMVDIHTVGAGGGSVAWRDPGGALRVGPRSAGAEPGPACYGRGGTEPTVTDANLVLGRLHAGGSLAGGVQLDRGAAERAIGTLAADLDLDLLACAEGIVRVADAEMLRALRVMTVEQGIDPRRFALLAFGGAGPLHAAANRRRARDDDDPLPARLGRAQRTRPRGRRPPRDRAAHRPARRRRAEHRGAGGGPRRAGDRRAARRSATDDRPASRVAHDVRYRGQAHELRRPRPGRRGSRRAARSLRGAARGALRLPRRRGPRSRS